MKYKTKDDIFGNNIPEGWKILPMNFYNHILDCMQRYADQEVERRKPTDAEIEKRFRNNGEKEYELLFGARWARDFIREEQPDAKKKCAICNRPIDDSMAYYKVGNKHICPNCFDALRTSDVAYFITPRP